VRLTHFARLIVMVKSAKAAERVLESLTRSCEGRQQLVVNRAKSRAVPLKACEFGEAMDAAAHAPPESPRAGYPSRRGAQGDAQPQRLLADESELIRPARLRASPYGLRFAPSMAARRRRGH
jgi:hypothetical protein